MTSHGIARSYEVAWILVKWTDTHAYRNCCCSYMLPFCFSGKWDKLVYTVVFVHWVIKADGGCSHFAYQLIRTSAQSLHTTSLLATICLQYAVRQLCRYIPSASVHKIPKLMLRIIRSTAAHLYDGSMRTSVSKKLQKNQQLYRSIWTVNGKFAQCHL